MFKFSKNAVHGNEKDLYWYKSERKLDFDVEKWNHVRVYVNELHSSN